MSMTQEEKQAFNQLVQEVQGLKSLYEQKLEKLDLVFRDVEQLMQWMNEKKERQLSLPLDPSSMKAIVEGLRNTVVERLNVRDIFFQATQESPTEEGQMRFFNDRSTQTFRATTTKGVFTGSIELTAV